MNKSSGRAVPLLILLLIGVIAMFTPISTAHEPITTKVMFNREVIRILQRNCLECHSPGRIKADIPLTSYREARPWAKAIKEEVLERRMMPFQAVRGYGRFSHSYAISQRDQELLISWIEGGAPKGEESDYPREEIRALARGGVWPAGEPDQVLEAPAVNVTADAGMVTRCEVLPVGNQEERWIEGLDLLPGNGAIVDGANYFIAPSGTRSPCSLPESRLNPLGSWSPATVAARYPEGYARRLPANARIVLKLRYRGNGEAASDRSRLGLHFASTKTSRSVETVSITAPPATIPAAAASHRIVATKTITEDREALAIRPLPYPYATSVEVSLSRPDGSGEVLVLTRGYRFPWQPAYYFKSPVEMPRGSVITITAYIDNSESNPTLGEGPIRQMRFTAPLCELTMAVAVTR